MQCSICERIPPSSRTKLSSAASALRRGLVRSEPITGPCSVVDLWECTECGLWYVYTAYIDHDAYMYGSDGDETLDRLTREESDVVHAVLGCKTDPAAIEDALFALPPHAFDQTLWAAYRKDRDFIALFIPRLVHALAARSHATRELLYALVDAEPSYANEVLAAATSLPPELHEALGTLEQHCRDVMRVVR